MSPTHEDNDHEKDGGSSEIDSLVRAVAHFPEAAPRSPEPYRIGKRIDRFEITARVGAGGMGVVYSAEDIELHRRVALKIMPAELVTEPQRARRFAAEAGALASLDHPAIVRYIAHGETPAGEPFIAMEWLDGEDLAKVLRRRQLSVRESIALGLRVAEALATAHERGIVHRDIKPSNLFLTGGDPEQVTILDFGIARFGDAALSLTASGAVIGTPGYMAPEQARGEAHVDARADVFSLGCVLFECLTGEPAFGGAHLVAVLTRILFEEPPRARDKRPDVSEALSRLLDQMLAKRPIDRPRDGHVVAEALRALRDRVATEPDELPKANIQPTALTGGEQRALAVILISAPKLDGSEREGTGSDERIEAALRREARLHGGQFERLLDGSGAALLTSSSLATDLAAQAARCALALRTHATGRSIALAMGRDPAAVRLPMGLTIDRAARLMGGSSIDGPSLEALPILLDEVTAGLLDARFDVRELDHELVLCGERELAEGTRTLLGKATPCVGRDREIRTLEQLFDECREERVAQAVLVTAPAGAGKSRLAHELLRHVKESPEPVALWIGRGDPLRAGSAFGLLGQVLRRAAGIQDGEPLAIRRQKLGAHVEERVVETERRRIAEFLGEIIGTPFSDDESPPLCAARREPQLMSEQMRRAFLDLLTAECAARPVMIVLEDLHWGDRSTVQFLDQALRVLRERPLFVLALARPEVRELFPNLWSERRFQVIHLAELTRKAIEHLARHVLGKSVDQDTIERLIKLSEGNAFYLEELIRKAAEGHRGELPETVVAMVQSRLGALDDEARRLLRAASVFGEVFWAEGAAALLGGEDRTSKVRERLRDLVAREIIIVRGESRFPGQEEVAFRHALLREGAYAMLTSDDRELGHRLAGEWLELHGEPDMLVLAEHCEQGKEAERAAVFYMRATEQVFAANDLEGALAHAERGLRCGASGSTRGALLAYKAFAHSGRVEFATADRCGAEALDLLEVGGLRWCQCMGCMFLLVLQQAQMDRFAALSQRFSSIEPGPEALAAYVEAGSRLAVTWTCPGPRDTVRRIVERMDRLCAAAMLTDASARGWVSYGAASYGYVFSDDPWAAYVAAQRSNARFKEAGDRRMVSSSCALLGVLSADLLGLGAAEATLREGLAAVEEFNETLAFAYIAMHLSLLLAERGPPDRLDDARSLAKEIIDTVPTMTTYGGIARAALAHVHLREDDLLGAEAHARKAREILSVTPGWSPPAFVVQIATLLRQQRVAEARAIAEEALGLLRFMGGAGTTELQLRLIAAEARHADGDIDAAREAIRDAMKELHARADKIADSTARAHFLCQVPSHARIEQLVALWQAGGRSYREEIS